MSDETNPTYMFQTTHTELLVRALRGEIDLKALVAAEMASRGLYADGKWVGHAKAASIHGTN